MKLLSRVAAFGIVGVVLLITLALFHHPIATSNVELAQQATRDNQVHGTLILLLAVLASTLAVLSEALNERSGALYVYRLGCALLGVAMLLDGFVTPQLADAATALRPIGVTIQVFSKAGFIAQSAAILLWSCTAWRRVRWFAVVGLVAAIAPAAWILFGDLLLVPRSLIAIFATHSAWYLSAAWVLYRFSRPSA
ncbi:hypothetical protein [Duganella aceris]|uniref:DUF4386 family protein n=1 Tax=Duganella aceris TaxID=2703883 RepID=A0ABX0FNU7_9BURK|nr:hypothetical protein [Duganella aceris]NGZ86307.1 hypothetical protein [Duganella aceris]